MPLAKSSLPMPLPRLVAQLQSLHPWNMSILNELDLRQPHLSPGMIVYHPLKPSMETFARLWSFFGHRNFRVRSAFGVGRFLGLVSVHACRQFFWAVCQTSCSCIWKDSENLDRKVIDWRDFMSLPQTLRHFNSASSQTEPFFYYFCSQPWNCSARGQLAHFAHNNRAPTPCTACSLVKTAWKSFEASKKTAWRLLGKGMNRKPSLESAGAGAETPVRLVAAHSPFDGWSPGGW